MGESDENVVWDWVDPGAFALMGAASFLSGTSRLPITSVVMMVCEYLLSSVSQRSSARILFEF